RIYVSKYRWWAYKWLKRFDNAGLRGLENRHRSGRPPEVSDETSAIIRQELSENHSGWMAKCSTYTHR
ncbi:MAG TPA: helix-turn-helix domain-containing protein, partial [Candidatus Eisenbacteria bacterium]|nr:helix-turn-helix domain-containing protein [Candidatus Eisenbacteria bacterium]